jgi:hypothetical protein
MKDETRLYKGVAALILGGGLILSLIAWLSVMSIVNEDVKLRSAASAQQDTNKAVFDTMWKILQQQAGIVDKYKKDFQEIWPALIAGRYKEGGGQMMQWIQERNPNFDSGLYRQLMSSIEAQRERFSHRTKVFAQDQRTTRQLTQKCCFWLGVKKIRRSF